MTALLEVHDVTKSFGAVAAMRGVSFPLYAGEAHALVAGRTARAADIGHLAAYTGAALASGQVTGAEGEKFTAGKLGEYTIGKDGEIVLGPPAEFTAANIDKYDF